MNFFYLRSFIAGFLFSLISVFAVAQRSNGLAIEGKISVQQGLVEGAYIQMFMDGRRMENYGIGADGRYKVELTYNHKYELIFTLEKNFSQKIVVESTVPKDILQTDPKFPPFPLNINLFTEIPGIDKSFVNNTILKIYYSRSVDNFISELYYNDAQIAKLIEQAVLQSKMVGKESDYLSKLSKAELAEMKKEYNSLIEQAGKEYSKEEFLAALDGFKAAGKIFPNEQFPKDRIAEINDLLGLIMVAAELDKALAERFTVLIKEADLFFNQKNYTDARNSYNRALSIKPADSHAIQQISVINDLLKKQQSQDQYEGLVAKADNSFKQLLYNEALKTYQEALSIKPNEAYPKTKIQEINGILAEESKNAEKQESYKQAMQQGEIMFQKQFYEKSLASYENALSLKPGDQLATKKIEDVKAVMKSLADKLMYDKLILSADKSFKKELYNEALADYTAAAVILPDDKYAARRIEEINEKLKLEGNFAELIKNADDSFAAKKYDESKSFYSDALKIRANDKYATDRIKEIDGILAARGVDEKYNAAVSEADRLFTEKKYEDARGKFTEASAVKPKETYPKTKIAEIGTILQQLAKNDQDYQKAVTKADGLMQQKQYDQAIISFSEAGKLKPEEKYPAEMIAKANVLIVEQKQLAAKNEAERIRLEKEKADAEAARLAAIQAEKDKNYADAIAKADNLFNEKNYEAARTEYRAALTAKPNESYPQQKIDEIGKTLAAAETERKEKELLDKNYTTLIQQADRFFTAKTFDQSKSKFQEAQKLKPAETYPAEKIAEIEKILAQQAVDEQYRVIILAADGFFKTEKYLQAKTEYEKALTVKSEEQYPKNQIAKIDDILQKEKQKILSEKNAAEDLQRRSAEIAKLNEEIEARGMASESELNSLYDQYISQGDAFFDSRDYIVSRGWYYRALSVKNLEKYPKQRIDEINRLLGSLLNSQLDRDYQKFVDLADSTFRENQYAVARGWYNRALGVKANEKYPKDQLEEIESKIAERMAGQSGQQFDTNMQKAAAAFEAKNYSVARFWYKKALELRPDNTDAKNRLKEIDEAMKK